MSTDLTIIIPTYNECQNILPVIKAIETALTGNSWQLLFVDDNSPDGTAELIEDISKKKNNIKYIKRIGRKGRTSACIEGMVSTSTPYMCIMDADLQHDEKLLPEMLTTIKQEDYDLVIGSRYVNSGSTGSLPFHRVIISKLAGKFGSLILKHKVSDPTSGFFMIRNEFFRMVNPKLSGKGMKGFELTLDILASADKSLRYIEIPYTMRDRKEGDSKLDVVVIFEFISLVLYKLLRK